MAPPLAKIVYATVRTANGKRHSMSSSVRIRLYSEMNLLAFSTRRMP